MGSNSIRSLTTWRLRMLRRMCGSVPFTKSGLDWRSVRELRLVPPDDELGSN